jgi:Domain of unknown function (DUF1707)
MRAGTGAAADARHPARLSESTRRDYLSAAVGKTRAGWYFHRDQADHGYRGLLLKPQARCLDGGRVRASSATGHGPRSRGGAKMAGPGDGTAADAGTHGHVLASHADREQVIEMLKAAFVQGRLEKTEFDLRVGRVLASRTYADLAVLAADIPAWLATARPPEPAGRSVDKKAVAAVAYGTPALVGMVAATRAMPDATPWPIAMWALAVTLVLLLGVPTCWLWLFHEWLETRAVRQSGQGPPHRLTGGGFRASSGSGHSAVRRTGG